MITMRALATGLAVFLLCVSPLAQGTQHDWEAVKALNAGATVRAEQLGGRQVEGRLVSVDDSGLTIKTRDTTIAVDRQSVRQIDRVGRQVRKRAGLGLLIGVGAGALLGHSTAETNKGLWTGLMAVGWGAVGTLIGVVDGLSERDYRLVYRNPSP